MHLGIPHACTLHEDVHSLFQGKEQVPHGYPFLRVRCHLDVFFQIVNLRSEPLKLVRGLHSTTERAICWVD